MITRNNICYDFSVSPYRKKVDNKVYVFSSKLHKDKFESRLKNNRDMINLSLTKRFSVPVYVDELCDYILYKKIETRGFLIIEGGSEICKNNIKFVGENLTKSN